ncbi:MAG: hypothetical protein VX938_01210, partial [Myxococcota bacterium]|nr:hypothetical protein [Myxococcota bacterium]
MKIMNLLTISLCAIALTMTVGCASDDDGDTTPTTEADASSPADDAAAPADDAAAPADDAAAPADDAPAPADDAAAPADDAAAPAAGACTN